VEPDLKLLLEDATSILEAIRRVVRYASDATEALEVKVEDGHLDGKTEAVELREAPERLPRRWTGSATSCRRSYGRRRVGTRLSRS